jgi:NADH-quinone oxidoreductase subunit E
MSAAALSLVTQPAHFAFSPENVAQAQKIIARYPQGRQASAVMPLLTLAQKQNDNWLPRAAMDTVADMLGMAPIRVYEVASFYTMYNLAPVGKHLVELCTTTPCWLKGSDDVVRACEKHLGVKLGETTPDGQFTLREVECLGACVNAPMAMIGEQFYEDLNADNVVKMLDALRSGNIPKPGPQSGRRSSEPAAGLTTLKNRQSA